MFTRFVSRAAYPSESISFILNVHVSDPDNMKSVGVHDPIEDFEDEFRREKWASVILMYLIVDRARRDEIENTESALPARIGELHHAYVPSIKAYFLVVKFAPKLLNFLTDLLADLRWDDTHHLPHSKVRTNFVLTLQRFNTAATDTVAVLEDTPYHSWWTH